MEAELTKKQRKIKYKLDFFKKPKYSDEDYKQIGFWSCIASATLTLSLFSLLAGSSVKDLLTIISYVAGVFLGVKSALILKSSHSTKEEFNKAIKFFIIAGLLLGLPNIINLIRI